MNTFQCVVCNRKIETITEQYVAPKVLARERVPVCCGEEMMEVVD